MADEENLMTKYAFIVIIIGFIGLILYNKYGYKIFAFLDFLKSINWGKVSIIGSIILIIGTLVVFTIYTIVKSDRKEKRKKQEYVKEQEKELGKIFRTDFSYKTAYGTEVLLKELKESIDKIDSIVTFANKDKINKFYKKVNNLIKRKQEEEEYKREQKELEKERQEELERERHNKLVNELLEFKKKNNSIEAIPLNKKYSKDVISYAKIKMQNYLRKKHEQKEKREEAINYYKECDIDSKPYLDEAWEEEIYTQIREEVKSGKLNLKQKPKIEYEGKKLENIFYRAKNLNEEERRIAVAQGFVHVKGNELDGKICGGGFYIKKENRESKKHFYLKHLFAELHDNMKVEYQIGDKRVDVALLILDLKIGVEIETGANRDEQILEKVKWLNKHFDEWIFVCQRQLLPRYERFVDNKKSRCLTPKKAKEFILSYDSPCMHR